MAELKDADKAMEDPVSDYEKGRRAGYRDGFKEARAVTLIVVMNALFASPALNDDL